MNDYLYEKERYKKTLTVKELIHVLKQCPDDKKVFITWESTINAITEKEIYVAYTGSVYIDGDYSFYREEFMKNKEENETQS